MAMTRSQFLTRWMFSHQSYPAPFDGMKSYTTAVDCLSRYNVQANQKRATLSAPLLKALTTLYELIGNAGNNGALGADGDYSCAEYHSRSGALHLATYHSLTGAIKVIVKTAAQGTGTLYTPYNEDDPGYDGTVIWLGMIPYLVTDQEFSANLGVFLKTPVLTEERKRAAYILCDNVYRRIASGAVKFDSNIGFPSCDSLKSCKPQRMAGEFTFFECRGKGVEKEMIAGDGHESGEEKNSKIIAAPRNYSAGAYKMNAERVLTDAEKKLVPVLDKSFVISQEAKEICQLAYSSSMLPNPFRNFMLYGPAGTGKTSSAIAIAVGLGLPYTLVTCSPETEKIDLLGQILPASVKGTGNEVSLDPETIEFDPETAYFQLTGETKNGASSLDCIKEILDRTANQPSDGFYFQESELIKALKNGWTVELQEPATITNPAALTCLNSIFDPHGLITLPNGEVIRRHPDCVIIITTNLSYEGCRAMNQAVMDRIQYSKYIPLPNKSVMVKRGMAKTGCTNKDMVEKMAGVIIAAEKYCSENFCDGIVGMRSFYNWITMAMITGDPYESALTTVISKATTDKKDQESLKEAVLENIFSAKGKSVMTRRKNE